MNESVIKVPEMRITHDGELLFKRVFTLKNTDGTLRDISAIVPVFQITLNGFPVLTLEGTDVQRDDLNSRFVVRKAPAGFAGFDCVQQYRFRFYDTATGSVFAKGVFRISNCAMPGVYAAFGVSTISGSAVDNTDPNNPVINIPEVELPASIVESISGSAVDNTDPNNPVINIPEVELPNTIVQSVTGTAVNNTNPAHPVIDIPAAVGTNTQDIADLKLSLASISGFQVYTPAMVASSFITRSTGLAAGSADYRRTAPIALSALGNQIKISIGTFGGSIAPVAYYSSSSIATANYISSEIATVGGSQSSAGQQLTGYILNPPANATHVIFSVHKDFTLKIEYKVVDQATRDAQTAFIEGAFSSAEGTYGAFANPFTSITGAEPERLFRRSARTVGLPADAAALIIVAGQSNADGRELKTASPQWLIDMGYKITNYMVWNRTTNAFQSYELGVNTGASNNTDTKFGFDIFFAKAWLDANPTKKLYCIKQTLGGVPITEKGQNTTNNNGRWQPKTELITTGQLSMINELATKIAAVKTFCVATRLRLVPLAVLWHQGEGDADRAADGAVTDYPMNLANLISCIRGMVQAPALPWLTATLHPVAGNANYPAISNVILQLDTLDPNMKAINMSSNTQTIDGLHFSAAPLALIGQGMYNDLLTL